MHRNESRHQALEALQGQRFFKLICGASYRNLDVIEQLSYLYALAGAQVIDVTPDPTAVWAARRGIDRAGSATAPLIMVSVGTDHDPHFQTLAYDADACETCPACTVGCPFDVTFRAGQPGPGGLINCIGCGHCLPQCRYETLSLRPVGATLDDHRRALQQCRAAGATALEIHTTGDWAQLLHYHEMAVGLGVWDLLAFSLTVPPEAAPEMAARVVALAGPGIVLQCDGRSISGRAGRASTMPALEVARAVAGRGLPAYLQAAGGANDLTGLLAREMGVPLNGVGMGSFARTALRAGDEAAQLAHARRLVASAGAVAANATAAM